jgi:hypothetical protein
MEETKTFEDKIRDLLRKKIRPVDIARILEVPHKQVVQIINVWKAEEAAEKLENECIGIILGAPIKNEPDAKKVLRELLSKISGKAALKMLTERLI